MIWLIAWMLAFVSIAAASLALAIASVFTSGKSQLVCVDGFLGAGTLLVILWSCQGVLPKDTHSAANKYMTVSKEHRVIQADYAASSLTAAQYMDDFVGPLRPVMAVDGYRTLKGSLPAAESSVQTLIDKYPLDAELTSRLVILKHAGGEDVHPVFAKFARAGGQASALLNSLAALYDSYPQAFVKDDVKTIEQALPGGWYRRTALIDAYKKTGDTALKAVDDEYKQKSSQWNTRALVIQMLTVSSLIPALYVVFLLLSRMSLNAPPFVPICADFRRGYGTILAVAYAQSVAVFLISVIYGIIMGITHGALKMDHINVYLTTGSVGSAVIVATACFYYLICKPRGLSILSGFLQGSEGLTWQNEAKYIAAGYCSMMALSFCVRTILNQIPNFPQGMTNAGQAAMMQAMFSTNTISVLIFAFAICLIAPLFEELLFRGLMYGWVRNRFGVLAGTIVNSLVFAAWHFDPPGFFQYFFMGVALSVIYERSRSLRVVVACHALWNITVLIVDSMLLVH